MGVISSALGFYDKKYKLLLAFSIALLLISTILLGINYARTGEFITKGVSLKGGITLTLPINEGENAVLQNALSQHLPQADILVRSITEAGRLKAFIIEASDVEEDALIQALREEGHAMKEGTYSIELMGSTLGQSFFKQIMMAVMLAFAAMALVVLITFRKLLPSAYVILAIVSDIVSTLAVLSLLNVRLSTAGIAALLMLIGYSVDTDILLTTRVLKHKEGVLFERITKAARTGILMSLTSFSATFIAFLFTQSDVVKQIMLILSIGLLFDIIYTWFQNAGILRWWLERKEARSE